MDTSPSRPEPVRPRRAHRRTPRASATRRRGCARSSKAEPPAIAAPPAAAPGGARRRHSRACAVRPADDREQRQQARRALVEIGAQESVAALTARVTTERPFVERLVAFWSNHLCVSTGAKVLVAPLAGSYEREAIRPHVLGRFEDMVLASAKHPAMLVYLDNFQSIGPNSRGARAARPTAAPRAERELRARAAGAAHARRQRRLHAAGRAGAGEDPDRLDGRRPGRTAGRRAAATRRARATRRRSADDGRSASRSRSCCTSRARKTVLGATLRRGRRRPRASAPSAICAAIRRRRSSSPRSSSRISSPTIRPPPPSSASRACSATATATCGPSPRALVECPRRGRDGHAEVPDAAGLVGRGAARVRRTRRRRDDAAGACASSAIRSGRPQAPKGFGDTMQEWADPDSLLNRAELARTIARRLRQRRLDPRGARSTSSTSRQAIRCARCWPTRRLPPPSASRSPSPGPAFQWR